MSSVWSFAFLWCFESLAAGAPTEEGKKEQGMQLCQGEMARINFVALSLIRI